MQNVIGLIFGLIVDFKVMDSDFLAKVLLQILDLKMYLFLKEALHHLHSSGFLLDLVVEERLIG